MDLEALQSKFQYINTLSTDGDRFLIIGTEGGMILIFSLIENKILCTIDSDPWICSMYVANGLLYTVGGNRSIKAYSLRSFKKVMELPQESNMEAYSAKGIKLSPTAISNTLLANVGYGKFKIIDTKRRKVIYSFDIAKDTLQEVTADHGTAQPTVVNYCVIKNMFKVCYLLEEDDHLYFYNYKFHKLLKKIRLFDYQANIRMNTLLVNSLILEQDGYLFVILQFSRDRGDNHEHLLKTIMYVVRVYVIGEHRNIKVLFYKDLRRYHLIKNY